MKPIKRYFLLFLKGMGMGIAELIPSISSATIALITGIYGALLHTIHAFNLTALRLLMQGKWQAFWHHINGPFLFTLVSGILTSLFTTLHILHYLLSEKTIQTWSFFFGLMLIACITVYQQIRKFTYPTLFFSIAGTATAYSLIHLTPLQSPNSPIFILLSGAIAFCAMILPGISGSFMLLLLGKYSFMLDALQHLHWQPLSIFLLGGILGLITFTRLLKWLLSHYHDFTIALLAGFMLGSLPKTWPWKQIIHSASNQPWLNAVIEKNVSPVTFQKLTQQDPLILEALLCMSLGCLLVITFEKLAAKKRKKAYFL